MSGSRMRPPRRRDGPATVARIRGAAASLIARHGFDAVGMQQIAAHAGVAVGAVYHHYPSKEDLYADVTRQAFRERGALPADLASQREPAELRLRRLIEWFVREVVLDETFGALLHRELLDPRPSTPRLLDRDQFHAQFALFRRLIRQLAPRGDVDQAVAATLALILGFANLRGIHALFPQLRRSFHAPADIAGFVTALLLRGLPQRGARAPRRHGRARVRA